MSPSQHSWLTCWVSLTLNYNKLKSPPPAQEQIELICKRSLEKYRVALYGASIYSVMDLLLRAHELHAVLGPSGCQTATFEEKPDQ